MKIKTVQWLLKLNFKSNTAITYNVISDGGWRGKVYTKATCEWERLSYSIDEIILLDRSVLMLVLCCVTSRKVGDMVWKYKYKTVNRNVGNCFKFGETSKKEDGSRDV